MPLYSPEELSLWCYHGWLAVSWIQGFACLLCDLLLLLDAKVSFCEADSRWVVHQIDWSALAHQKDLNSICLWWLQFPGWTKSLSSPRQPPTLHFFLGSASLLKSCRLISWPNRRVPAHVRCMRLLSPVGLALASYRLQKGLWLFFLFFFPFIRLCMPGLFMSSFKMSSFKVDGSRAWISLTVARMGTFKNRFWMKR